MSADNADALKELQRARNYWIVNWRMVQHFGGFEEAVLLGYLSSMQDYWSRQGKLKQNKWFYCTKKDMREQTTIEARKQKTALNHLKEMGFIEMIKKPASSGAISPTWHFHVNADVIKKKLSQEID